MDKPFTQGFLDVFKPLPNMDLDEWAELYRILPRSGSSSPGPWRNSRTPYLVEVMKCLSPNNRTKEIAFMKGIQIGATESGLNWILYSIDVQPGPFLAVQPTDGTSKRWSKQRVGPSIEACERLQGKIKKTVGRSSGNSLQQKDYPGGTIVITGSGSPSSLASMPMGNLYLDEIDKYEDSAGKAGDPIELVKARISTYPRAKIFYTSTPLLKETSRITALYEDSDQRVYELPCPHCSGGKGQLNDGFFSLEFDQFQWPKGQPEKVLCYCPLCGGAIEEWQKTKMLAGGRWVAKNPGHWRTGFHLSALYSPVGWLSWVAIARRFEANGNDPERRKTFANEILGIAWEEEGETLAADIFDRRKEKYEAEVPDGVLMITLSGDVQKERLEYEIRGWGVDEESWGIEYGIIHGDTTELSSGDKDYPSVWEQLDELRLRDFKRADGRVMRISCVFVDSGYRSDTVYKYTKERERMRVFSVKGSSSPNSDISNKPTRRNKYGAALFMVGSYKAKEVIHARLKIDQHGGGYMHFPAHETSGYNGSYYAGLICEKQIPVYRNGYRKLIWHKPKDARNEPLDLAVYNLAAIRYLNPKWEVIAARFNNPTSKPLNADTATPKSNKPPAANRFGSGLQLNI